MYKSNTFLKKKKTLHYIYFQNWSVQVRIFQLTKPSDGLAKTVIVLLLNGFSDIHMGSCVELNVQTEGTKFI